MTHRLLLAAAVLTACAPEPTTPPLVCGPGTEQRDGACVVDDVPDDDPPSIDDLLDRYEPCDPTRGDNRLDLVNGCVDGGCAGDRYDELVAEWGEPVCEPFPFPGSLACTWNNIGMTVGFTDPDEDGEPNDTFRTFYEIPLPWAFTGSTADGLGTGRDLGCFLETFPEPYEVTWWKDGDHWWPVLLRYETFELSDVQGGKDETDRYAPDGVVDHIMLVEPW